MKIIGPLLLLCWLALAQPKPPSVQTKGACSPVVTGNGNTVTIKTCGQQESDELRKLLKTIISNQQLDATTILKKLDGCLQQIADRRLTDPQRALLIASLHQLRGHKISIVSVLGDKESKRFAEDFVEVFREAEWTGLVGSGHAEANYDRDPIGVVIQISKVDFDSRSAPPDAEAVARSLAAGGIPFTAVPSPQCAAGTFELVIGIKPPSQ